MEFLPKLILFVLVVGIADCGKLVQLMTMTTDEFEAGMIWPSGKISLDICGTTFGDCCQIHDMSNDNINFNPGWIDQFSGEFLQGCDNFEFPNNVVDRLMLWHAGFDAWKFDWIRMVFDDISYVQCNGGVFIDNETSLLVNCS